MHLTFCRDFSTEPHVVLHFHGVMLKVWHYLNNRSSNKLVGSILNKMLNLWYIYIFNFKWRNQRTKVFLKSRMFLLMHMFPGSFEERWSSYCHEIRWSNDKSIRCMQQMSGEYVMGSRLQRWYPGSTFTWLVSWEYMLPPWHSRSFLGSLQEVHSAH